MRKLVFVPVFALAAVALVVGGAGRHHVPRAAAAEEPAAEPVRAFLELGDIKGESTVEGFENQIEVTSWSWGQASRSAGEVTPGTRSSQSVAKPFRFQVPVSTATPQLFLAAASGRIFPTAVLTVVRTSGDVDRPIIRGTVYNAQLVGQDVQAAKGGNEVAVEELVLVAESVEWEYRPQLADGSLGDPVTAGWDFSRQRAR